VPLYRWRSTGSRAASGVLGNPEAASAGKGQRLMDAIAQSLASKLGNAELWELPWDSDPVA
jgi:creatinine amidohydrolase/Fe(II)-dependent formamide hydrolase-like protein